VIFAASEALARRVPQQIHRVILADTGLEVPVIVRTMEKPLELASTLA
jgi:hypothetical protein